MANEIISEIILNLDTFRAQLKEAEKEGKDSGGNIGDNIAGAITGSLKAAAIAAAAVGAAAVAALGVALHKGVEEAIAGEQALNQFNGALAATGHFSEDASARFVAFANSLQEVSTVSGDVIIKNGALLASIGRLSGEGLEKATQASLDLAAGLQGRIGVDQAFALVAKAADGNAAALGRYGIRVQETGNQARDFAAALAAIQARFGGAAEREVNTFSGAWAQLKNNLNDALKPLGELITRSPLVIGVMNFISQAFATLAHEIKKGIGNQDIIGNMVRGFLDFGMTIAKYVLPPLELLYNLVKDVAMVMKTGLLAVITTASFALQGLLEIAALFSDKFAGMRDSVKAFTEGAAEHFTTAANDTVATVGETLNFGLSSKFEETLANADSFVHQFSDKMTQLPVPVNAAVDEMTKELLRLQNTLRQIMLGTMVSITSQGAQMIGAALIKGSLSFADFKNFALNAMGDMSIKMGEAMIAQSAAFQALATLISNPFTSAGASLAFGLALIAIGGILKAAAGGGAGASAGVGGGGVDTGGGVAALPGGPSTVQENVERQAPSTNIAVHIAGNVLDRRESGLAIAEIIQETFGSNGITYATAGA